MSKLWATFLISTFAFLATASAAPPVRQFNGPGSPPFKVLKTGENPRLDTYDNFVIGPQYVPAPERKMVEGVPKGEVQQFTIDSRETSIYNPGIARKKFGTVDPKNPKTLIVETHEIDYKRQITVYIPAQHQPGAEAPFMVSHDGPKGKANMGLPRILDNLIVRNEFLQSFSSRSPTVAVTPKVTSAAKSMTACRSCSPNTSKPRCSRESRRTAG